MDLDTLTSLRKSVRRPAIVWGNGARLRHFLPHGAALAHLYRIGVNRSTHDIASDAHVHVDRSTVAPPDFAGPVFGPEVLYTDTPLVEYWRRHAALTPMHRPPYSGLYAIEVAAFLGCAPIYLAGFDCDGTHYYDKPGVPRIGVRSAEWLAQARPRLPKVLHVTIPGTGASLLTVDGAVRLDELLAQAPKAEILAQAPKAEAPPPAPGTPA